MLLFANNNKYKKVCIWKDEVPFKYVGQNTLHLSVESGDINWHIGTICIEVKLNCWHASNDCFFKSQVLPFNKEVTIGLNKEFADAIDEFFKGYLLGKLPGGTIEILGGAFDEVGSSNFAFKKVMNMLLFVFQHIDEFDEDKLQGELLKLM